jgi:hypothetical protein
MQVESIKRLSNKDWLSRKVLAEEGIADEVAAVRQRRMPGKSQRADHGCMEELTLVDGRENVVDFVCRGDFLNDTSKGGNNARDCRKIKGGGDGTRRRLYEPPHPGIRGGGWRAHHEGRRHDRWLRRRSG